MGDLFVRLQAMRGECKHGVDPLDRNEVRALLNALEDLVGLFPCFDSIEYRWGEATDIGAERVLTMTWSGDAASCLFEQTMGM